MSGNDHRKPGVVTAALLHGKYAEIICDFNHVSPQLIKLASKNIPFLYASNILSLQEDGEYQICILK